MSFPVRVRPQAQQDIESIVTWYTNAGVAVTLAFAQSLDAVVGRIGEAPMQFPIVYREIRRALLGRFPYGVFFTVDAETVEVLAVVHLHRDPKAWKGRS